MKTLLYNHFKAAVAMMVVLGGACTSCTNDFEEINTDPNKITIGEIQSYNMIESLVYNSAKYSSRDSWYWNNEIVQFTACTGQKLREEHRYKLTSTEWQTVWNRFAGYANNAAHVVELATVEGDEAMQAVGLTLKVLNMADLTDMFGDIPYREAFLGRQGGTTTPVFDSQKDVYELMLAELEQANEFYAKSPMFKKPSLDGIYGGDMAKWRRFNNSLMLRLLCRVSGRREMKAGERIKAIISDPVKYPVFTANSDNATVKFNGTFPYSSYFYNTQEDAFTTLSYKLSEQLISMMTETNGSEQAFVDPRLPIIGRMNTSGSSNPNHIWLGAVSGGSETECDLSNPGASYLNYHVLANPNSPYTFMDYAEVQFILSEMAYKGYIDGGETEAKACYERAVRASCEFWDNCRATVNDWGTASVPAAIDGMAVDNLLKSPLANWDLAEDKAEVIGNQKFLALFWHGFQAYHEIRRTNYPELKIGSATHYNDYQFPTRFAYPNNTVATNSAHVMEALKRMNGENDMHTPLWWSKAAIQNEK